MKYFKLKEMINGWFVGNFSPAAYTTTACEVAVKRYKKDSYESLHYHKIATEITVIVSGKVRMLDAIWKEGDILLIEPNQKTDFFALEDTVTVVIKIPGANDDKYMADN